MVSSKNFFYAKNLADVFYQIKTISDLQIVAGCTSFVDKELPENALPIRDIPDFKIIDKHERYIDFGSAVTLSEIEELGETNLPATLFDAITTIANPNVKNIATIGGNICSQDFYHTLYPTLLALDARLEFLKNGEQSFQAISKFETIPENSVLSKIRLPTEEWEVSIFRRLGPKNTINELSAGFVFLANSQKNQISDLRIAMAGIFKFRNIDLENKLIGAHLPLSENAIFNFLSEAEESFDENLQEALIAPILKRQFLNLVKYSLEQLT